MRRSRPARRAPWRALAVIGVAVLAADAWLLWRYQASPELWWVFGGAAVAFIAWLIYLARQPVAVHGREHGRHR